ncbi:hypothetical protein SALBM135S_03467 [Streptomyces alboniger]
MSDGTGHLSKLVWWVADLYAGGNFKSSEYGRVVLPFTVLRGLDYLTRAAGGPG